MCLSPGGSRCARIVMPKVTSGRRPLNTNVVEGINNTIKVIKRRAYGYRDEEYFFVKIRAAFPGNPR